MGKPEGEYILPNSAAGVQGRNTRAGVRNGCCFGCAGIRNWVNFRCVFALVLGCAVLLSAVFWLPVFHFGDQKALDLEYEGHDIVASFIVKKPTLYLEEQKAQLQEDIFNEISFSSTEVQILSLHSSAGPNLTTVVFAVKADSTTQSLIRSSFMSLVTGQSSLHLTTSLFGEPFSFEVLKFKGGLTVSPVQKAFLMQSVQILFNFTLNFSVDEILEHFDQLSGQLRTGLRLANYENLYISLINYKGSTIAPPTKVVSKVLLAVGINPSESRLKQLAQTITGSHSKNLGLNNTVFGLVKQISLSSVFKHSPGFDRSAPSPSPSYLVASKNHHRHRDHGNSRNHHYLSPAPSLGPLPSHGTHIHRRVRPTAEAPAPAYTRNTAAPPQPCNHRSTHKSSRNQNSHRAPYVSPSNLHRNNHPPKVSQAPTTSQKSEHSHADPPSTGEKHARREVHGSGVLQLPLSSSIRTIASHSWTLLLFISTAFLIIAPR